ncbi:MAG TPA: CCA tRNA nucleotidyltransferase [Thermoguttaceae bacterium]|nr:CCA tRNA nucleotidyltransferase [Thermoguttaceae bacterium]
MASLSPQKQRDFAFQVVRKLQDGGFIAFWAGGCVRDQLLGRTPKDYDVATNARPDQIRHLFRRHKTLAVGAAFGTITVVGPRGAGQVEVTTFRQDAEYSDGRHPDRVWFTSAQEDAQRRDFTINGLFYDPVQQEYIDYVGGREDIQRGQIRAIGDPQQRFHEDKLRMLRAVRFAAELGFTVEPATFQAIAQMADQILQVSAERIAGEMQRLLTAPFRGEGVRLLAASGLACPLLPEILTPHTNQPRPELERTLQLLERLQEPSFALVLAALLAGLCTARQVIAIGRRWRLSNQVMERAAWLVEHHEVLRQAAGQPWSKLQPILIHPGASELLALMEAKSQLGWAAAEDIQFCRAKLALPPEVLNPPPLITGDDLNQLGIPQGPIYKKILDQVRADQLDGIIQSADQALQLASRIAHNEANP